MKLRLAPDVSCKLPMFSVEIPRCSAWLKCHVSGQIVATSHDRFPQKVTKEGKSRYFREIYSRLVNYYSIWPDVFFFEFGGWKLATISLKIFETWDYEHLLTNIVVNYIIF